MKQGFYLDSRCKGIIMSRRQELEAGVTLCLQSGKTAVNTGCSASFVHLHNPGAAPANGWPSCLSADKMVVKRRLKRGSQSTTVEVLCH